MQLYMDWDAYYNKEPWFKKFRDTDLIDLVDGAGFDEEKYIQYVIPSHNAYGAEVVARAGREGGVPFEGNVGKLGPAIRWFVFGAWK